MSDTKQSQFAGLELPRRQFWKRDRFIPSPGYASFTAHFGTAFPKPQFLESDLGTTAVYDLPPPSGQSKRQVIIIHGLNTPAHGMLPLARELQALDANAYIVLFDLWGHGLSSTPLVAHTLQIVHHQVFQVLGFMQWTKAHIVGFSFGGSTAVTFALYNPWIASSVTMLAPGGLLPKEAFSERMQELLDDSKGRDNEAIDCVLSFLEGGPLVVPTDWQERMQAGQVVPEALRKWELEEHQGYPHSVLSLFRDGGVYGNEDAFGKFAKLPVRKIAVIAELDDVVNKSQLVDLGFDHVEIIEKADHSVVRTHAREVAQIVYQFWIQNA